MDVLEVIEKCLEWERLTLRGFMNMYWFIVFEGGKWKPNRQITNVEAREISLRTPYTTKDILRVNSLYKEHENSN